MENCEHKPIRKIGVTRKKEPKHVVNIKRIKKKENNSNVEHIRKITVMNFNKFYEKYMKDTTLAPDEYIDKFHTNIMMLYYHYKYDIYDSEQQKVKAIRKMLESFDYNTYIDIYTEVSYSKLVNLGIYESMANNMQKLYEVLHFLTIDNGEDIKLNHTLVDIRTTHFFIRVKTICRDRMIAIKEGKILDIAHNIKPSKEMKNSNILVEYRTNRFINVPYLYYKRLSEIEYLEFKTLISIIPHEECVEGNVYDDDNRMDLYKESERFYSIKDIIAKQMEIDANMAGFVTIAEAEVSTYVEYYKPKFYVYKKDGTVNEMNVDEFDSYYFPFLNW